MTGPPPAASDRFRFSTIAHAGRALLGPLSEASIEELFDRVTLTPAAGARPSVLDVGCGKGEVLVRALTRFDAAGVGIDPNAAYLEQAQARADSAGVALRLELRCGTFDAASIAPASFDLAICTGATHAFGDFDAALAGLAALVKPGGFALAGHGYWQREPAPDYLAAFGGSADEMAALEPTLGAAAAHGWTLIAHHASTRAEWDNYERGYASTMRNWIASHPNDPDTPAFRERIESWKSAYERWGFRTMGFVTMVLKRS